ncbi:MAG TPA: cofactor-independent phosphoglycerate mutase [Syntrophorhabdaceae bacterium]|nr:cofactor-independent phosphoglycerate mutase [Syntrophorhabdaceae bacterium]
MKYIVVIGDGMADFPLDELGGKTPLMAAKKPNMDMMARKGFCGKVKTVPDGFPPGSDVAGMSIFGYDPALYYTGRAPIEASGMGISMGPDDVAFRCNLVNIGSEGGSDVMGDYSGGHITTEEAAVLIGSLNEKMGGPEIIFFPGVGYRHIMIWKGGAFELSTTPPHDITGKKTAGHLPQGRGEETVKSLMDRSREILGGHDLNKRRIDAGKLPANSIWLWGQGRRAALPSFREKFGLRGATVCAVDLVRGISSLIGFTAPRIEGATGYLDTDYGAKARAALSLLKDHDIVYVHVEAPDEASHNGDTAEKIKAIECIDRDVLGVLLKEADRDTRFLIVTDHATPITMKTHFATPVPFAVYDGSREIADNGVNYDEEAGKEIITGEVMVRALIGGRKE